MQVTQKPGLAWAGGFPLQVPNEVRQNDPSFYVSYNSSPRDYGCATTALVVGQMEKFYILKGDHRAQYEAAGTLDACLGYFSGLPELQHQYSDKLQGV